MATKKKNFDKLTPKQSKFVEAIKKDPTIPIQKAARLAGYKQAPSSAYENLQKPNVRNALKSYLRALEIQGVNDKKSARVISEAMDAKKLIYVESGDSEDGKTREEVKDHPTRLKANEQYLKIKRLIGYEEGESGKDQSVKIMVVNYGKADSDSGRVISSQEVGLADSSGPVKISANCLAQKGKKNNPVGQ